MINSSKKLGATMTGVKWLVLAAAIGCAGGCAQRPAEKERAMKDVVFLTRDGCVNTPLMRGRLDEALQTLGLPKDYQVIDSDTLPASDRRGGYPTPTVLVNGKDLFGMEQPPSPHDAAT